MIPGMNAKQMQQAMKRMGIQQQEIDAVAVIIRTRDEDIIIRNPSVSKVNMMGQETYQVAGGEEERRRIDDTPEINEDDVKTVMEQAQVNEEEAKKALTENKGDLAAAIMSFQE